MEGIAKNNLSQELNVGDIKLHFLCVSVVLRDTFHDSGALGARLEFDGFSRVPKGTPELRERTSGTLQCILPPALLKLRERAWGTLKRFFSGWENDIDNMDTIHQSRALNQQDGKTMT